jgi:hypothetical protein
MASRYLDVSLDRLFDIGYKYTTLPGLIATDRNARFFALFCLDYLSQKDKQQIPLIMKMNLSEENKGALMLRS